MRRSQEDPKHTRHLLLAFVRKVSPRMSVMNAVMLVLGVILAGAAIFVSRQLMGSYAIVYEANETYQSCQNALDDFQNCSDALTAQARDYVSTGDLAHLHGYVNEAASNRREDALETLRQSATGQDAVEAVMRARDLSYALQELELYAMRLATPEDTKDLPNSVADVAITAEDAALTLEQRKEAAQKRLSGKEYATKKQQIREQIQSCSNKLITTLQNDLDEKRHQSNVLLGILDMCLVLMVILALFAVAATKLLLLWPMSMHAKSIRKDDPLVQSGSKELRYLTAAYNEMYEINQSRTKSLSHEAHFDPLTGVYNRGGYDNLLFKHRHSCALILVDIDNFKQFNDEYGHEMGDAILVEVSATLFASFRSTDSICRIGGDEFAVIMSDVTPKARVVIERKVEKVVAFLRDTSNELPSVTLSIGVTFADENSTVDGLFQRADAALYEAKRRGRDCLVFDSDLES